MGIGRVVGHETKAAPYTEPVFGIIVLVNTPAAVPTGQQTIDGVPLKFKVTGNPRLLGAPGRQP